jgi:hypothetical protein
MNCITSGAKSTPAGCGNVSFKCWNKRKDAGINTK